MNQPLLPETADGQAFRLASLSVRHFRNLEHVEASFSPRLNVFHGENGQGKTNLLEAIYALCTSKSFRTSAFADLLPFGGLGETVASVRGTFVEAGLPREQSLGLARGKRLTRIDGKRPPSLAEYARKSPVVVFYPGEMTLTMGPSRERRRLLDRVGFFTSPGYGASLESFGTALRSRQKVLETRGVHAKDLDHWEALCVTHGLAVTRMRESVISALSGLTHDTFAKVAAPGLVLTMAYKPSAPLGEADYAARLVADRERDARRGSAGTGPHRDDLTLELGGAPARLVASQGQHRALVLSLKAAEMGAIRVARGVEPILLLDDVSSELDAARTESYFRFLSVRTSQVFLTTTRASLIPRELAAEGQDRRDFEVRQGAIFAPP
ncbi:MAG: DNA replication and repair protein RecF [Polyangiaceae bacterium]